MLYVCPVTVTFCLLAMSCFTCYTFSKPKYTFLYGLVVFKWGNWVGQCVYVCLGLEETGAICLLWLVTGQREHSACRDLERSWMKLLWVWSLLSHQKQLYCLRDFGHVFSAVLCSLGWLLFPSSTVRSLWVETPLGSHIRLYYNS